MCMWVGVCWWVGVLLSQACAGLWCQHDDMNETSLFNTTMERFSVKECSPVTMHTLGYRHATLQTVQSQRLRNFRRLYTSKHLLSQPRSRFPPNFSALFFRPCVVRRIRTVCKGTLLPHPLVWVMSPGMSLQQPHAHSPRSSRKLHFPACQ